MLLPRTGVRLKLAKQATRHTTRFAEARFVSYSSKVRALPFVLSPEDAKQRVAFIASASAFLSAGAVFRSFLGSFGLSGGEVVQPKRVQAVYLPAWFIDGLVGARTRVQSTLLDQESRPEFMAMRLARTYMPGFSAEPMSRMGFADLASDDLLDTAVPFEEGLSRQYGQDIACLPYSMTPFALEDASRSLPPAQGAITDSFKFEPNTVAIPDLMAAYPVLIPVYLLQYEASPFGRPEYTFTIVAEAARRNGHVFAENTLRDAEQLAKDQFGNTTLFDLPDDLSEPDFFRVMPYFGEAASFARLEPFRTTFSLPNERRKELLGWIDDRVSRRGAMRRYEALQRELKQTVDMNYPLVRDVAESNAFTEYMHAEERVYQAYSLIEWAKRQRSTGANVKVEISFGWKGMESPFLGGGSGSMEKVLEYLEQALEGHQKARDQLKPEWRKQWDAEQTAESIARQQERFPWRAP